MLMEELEDKQRMNYQANTKEVALFSSFSNFPISDQPHSPKLIKTWRIFGKEKKIIKEKYFST